MGNTVEEEKNAVISGYFPIFHYNPETKIFKLDSKADFTKYSEFIGGEDRYRALKNINKDYKEILEENKKYAINRYKYYEKLAEESQEKKE